MVKFLALPAIAWIALTGLVVGQEKSNPDVVPELEPGFVWLFNGQNLEGWEGKESGFESKTRPLWRAA